MNDNINVCELIDAKQLEELTSSQVVRYAYEHTPVPANQPTGEETIFPTLHCRIYFPDDTPFSKIEVHYIARTVEDFGEGMATVPFDRALLHEGVEEISSSNVEGQGFVYENNTSGPLLSWRYPDGHVLTMRVSYADNDKLHQSIQMLTSFFEITGNRIPHVAADEPELELTHYPDDPASVNNDE
ncbi:hypothetical protein [Actinomyces sp. ZJ308]|uniref:hypothetical protein n=1 Tax=Actinomyces sp. ZJ308 TaxID=2708342 RepID=UPI001424485D|nr:hypothetical protein [Actinomyces sp. ZJ308]